MKCHAGANHADATDHGIWGSLCSECWCWVERWLERMGGGGR
jgi:hypothetical protein